MGSQWLVRPMNISSKRYSNLGTWQLYTSGGWSMYEPFLRKKLWNSGLDEDTLKKVVTIFIDILVKKKKI